MMSREQSASGKRKSSRESSLLTMGTIASTLEEARASLKQPSRPFTPAQDERHMFNTSVDYASRPSTAFNMDSNNFLEGLVRPPTSTSRLAPIPIQSKEAQPPQEDNGERRRRRSSSNGSSKNATNEDTGDRTRRSKKSEMDNLRATLEAAIPATPPTTPREAESNTESNNTESNTESNVKPSTGAWIKIKESLVSLDPSNQCDLLFNSISQIEATIISLSEATGVQRPLSTPKAKYVLERLFRLTDTKDPVLLMRVCKLVYLITDASVHVLNVCKLLYNLSKTAENDSLFLKERILDVLVEISTNEKDPRSKILVYGLGALKNVTSAEANQRALSEFPSLFSFFKNILITSLELKGDDKMAQLLIQVTAILRNLSMWKGTRQQMSDAIPNLCAILSGFSEHMEVVSNIVRILSKITVTSDNQRILSNCNDSVVSLMRVLQSFADNEALVLRTCFVLGNITVTIDDNRQKIFRLCSDSNILVKLLVKYTNSDIDNTRQLSKQRQAVKEAVGEDKVEKEKKVAKLRTACKETEQVLVKLVRVIANLAINEDIGASLASIPDIATLGQILERKEIAHSEELVLNVVAAITNLSFYFTQNNIILQNQISISKQLIPLLLFKNEEAIVESVRAYANFSRDPMIRQFMTEQKLDSMVAMLVEHSNQEIVQNVMGVLMNLVADPSCLPFIKNENLIDKLVDRLVSLDATDITLCETICKTLYNLTTVNGCTLFNKTQIQRIQKFLNENLEFIASKDNDIYEVLPVPKEKGEEDEDEVVTQSHEEQGQYAEFVDVAHRLLHSFSHTQ